MTANLHDETLSEWWRRFYAERGLTLSEQLLAELLEIDAEHFPRAARQDRERESMTFPPGYFDMAKPVDLIALWLELDGRSPDFIGPVEPPMVRRLRLDGIFARWDALD